MVLCIIPLALILSDTYREREEIRNRGRQICWLRSKTVFLWSPPLSVLHFLSGIHCQLSAMASDLTVQLTAPNGRSYSQPTGLFINNKWRPSSDGGKISSINPTSVCHFTRHKEGEIFLLNPC